MVLEGRKWHADAQFKMGAKYENGDDVHLDYKAADMYRKSAEQGNLEAQCSMDRILCSRLCG